MNKQQGKRGFSILEMILYVGIISMVMVTVVSLAISLLNLRVKERAMASIQSNEARILGRLEDAARHATALNIGTSVFSADPGTISFDMADVGVDPTIFSLTADDGALQVQEAGGAVVTLTTDDISVTNFTVTNLTTAEDVGILRVEMTLQVGSASLPIYAYTESFQTTLRIPLDN